MTSTPTDGLRSHLVVTPDTRVDLAAIDPDETYGHHRDSAATTAKAERDHDRLESLQERVWAERKHRILVILQGIDAAGKDGTISHVMSAFNPQGVRIVPFGVPNAVELAHDYLWRIHAATPSAGEIAVFNRSHYESVLVERVDGLIPERVWRRRYRHINEFERLLSDEGTTVVKFFLHISREEQRERIQARYDDPTKRWKFKLGDLRERERWNAYQEAFDDALSTCSTRRAPWYVIPANRKWFRNLAVANILADILEDLRPQYPPGDVLPPGEVIT